MQLTIQHDSFLRISHFKAFHEILNTVSQIVHFHTLLLDFVNSIHHGHQRKTDCIWKSISYFSTFIHLFELNGLGKLKLYNRLTIRSLLTAIDFQWIVFVPWTNMTKSLGNSKDTECFTGEVRGRKPFKWKYCYSPAWSKFIHIQ